MAAYGITEADAILKTTYDKDGLQDVSFKNRPLFALLDKEEGSFSKGHVFAVKYANGGGGSNDFDTAYAQRDTTVGAADFTISAVPDYVLASITTDLLDLAKYDEAAFATGLQQVIDWKIDELSNRVEAGLFRSGWGEKGQIASIASDVVTLTNREDAYNFRAGHVVVFADSVSSSTLRNSGTGLTVEAVDFANGKVTFTANVSTETGTTVSDYLFHKGDRQNSATPTRRGVMGLAAWLPGTVPASDDSFLGVNRSVDPGLYGVIHAPSIGTPVDEALIDAAVLATEQEGNITHFLMNHTKWGKLAKQVGSKMIVEEGTMSPKVGFNAIQVASPGGGLIKCIAAKGCPSDRIYGLDMSTWKLKTRGEAIHIQDHDGRKLRYIYNADALEARIAFKGNLLCNAPGRNVVITGNF